jgi:cytochrome P450 family 142 subfamily A polypeptide 1
VSEATARPDVNLLDGAFYGGDPYPAFAWMHAHEPIYHDRERNVFGITLLEDVMTISKDAPTFSSAGGIRPDTPALPMMIDTDHPEHTRRRQLVSKGFTPNRIAAMEPYIRGVCTDILDAVCERGSCDFVHDIAAWLPLISIGDMLGVAPEDRGMLLRWSDEMVSATGSPNPDDMIRAAQDMEDYRTYCLRVVAERRGAPLQSDLMSVLVHARVGGERLTDDDLVHESLLLLIGGDETTRHVISGGAYQLMLHPEQRQRLLDDPTRIPVAVEEMLRWVSPIQNMQRVVRRPARIRDHEFREGDRLLLEYGAANRDPHVFDRPHEFDAARDPNDHVAFGGYGHHICLGKSLARLELRVMFEELLRRLPDLEPTDSAPPPRRKSNFIVGYERLPVRFTPSAPVGKAA